VIEVEGLVRRYGEQVVVDGVSFVAPPGQVMGLLGPNGAGKTTTLRILCGCLGATSGTVRVAGHDVALASRLARQALGYLPEQPPLYDDMTVEDFLDHAARLRRVPKGERRSAVAQAVERVDLQSVRHRLIGRLSKGYRQRVGLAQAIVHRPRVLVLDEPTSGLDPTQVTAMRTLIRELRDEATTVLLSTHLLAEAEAMCDRVTILAGGRAVASGSLEELRGQLAGAPRLRLEVRDPHACAEALREHPSVAAVAAADGTLDVTLVDADDSHRIAVHAVAAGFGLLASRQDGLEELFRRAMEAS